MCKPLDPPASGSDEDAGEINVTFDDHGPRYTYESGLLNALLERGTKTIRKPALVCSCGRPALDCLCQICFAPTGAKHGKPARTRVRQKDVCDTCARRINGEQQAA